jgi:hypothetical protein
MFWSWLLATYAAVVVFTNRRKHRDMMPYVVAVLSAVQTFFLLMNNFVANPFQMLAVDKLITSVPDGSGLSPLLQYPAMAIHPPMLYLGYVGFAVPFAFAIGSLITRQPGEGWIHTTRRWTLITWLFQGTGIMLGAAWAYHVLGWGGYWGCDEGVEHRAGFDHLFPVHPGHDDDPLRAGAVGARLRAVRYRQVLRQLPGHRHRRDHLPDSGPAGLFEKRFAARSRGVA